MRLNEHANNLFLPFPPPMTPVPAGVVPLASDREEELSNGRLP